MALKDRIKEARINSHLTQEQLSSKLGIAKSTLAGYETGSREPSIEMVGKIMFALNVDANYLWQDECDFPIKVSYEEMKHIEKYRDLDSHGKKTVDFILNQETIRLNQIKEASRTSSIESQNSAGIHMCIYTYMQKIAAAGNGFYFDDIPTETLEAPYMEGADFIIGVSGDSMEPTYSDGDLVYVEKRQVIETGEIGIFIVNGECFIKEAGEIGLISHNKNYNMISGNEHIICVGKVLGKVQIN